MFHFSPTGGSVETALLSPVHTNRHTQVASLGVAHYSWLILKEAKEIPIVSMPRSANSLSLCSAVTFLPVLPPPPPPPSLPTHSLVPHCPSLCSSSCCLLLCLLCLRLPLECLCSLHIHSTIVCDGHVLCIAKIAGQVWIMLWTAASGWRTLQVPL